MTLGWRSMVGMVGAFIIAAAVAAWWIEAPPARKTVQQAEDWSLPSPNGIEEVEAAYQRLLSSAAWQDSRSNTAKSAAARKKNAAFELLGTVSLNSQRFALIRAANKVERYAIGDTLPGGAIVQAIGEGRVEVSDDDETKVYRIFHIPDSDSADRTGSTRRSR